MVRKRTENLHNSFTAILWMQHDNKTLHKHQFYVYLEKRPSKNYESAKLNRFRYLFSEQVLATFLQLFSNARQRKLAMWQTPV